jgi:hypothetical protein
MYDAEANERRKAERRRARKLKAQLMSDDGANVLALLPGLAGNSSSDGSRANSASVEPSPAAQVRTRLEASGGSGSAQAFASHFQLATAAMNQPVASTSKLPAQQVAYIEEVSLGNDEDFGLHAGANGQGEGDVVPNVEGPSAAEPSPRSFVVASDSDHSSSSSKRRKLWHGPRSMAPVGPDAFKTFEQSTASSPVEPSDTSRRGSVDGGVDPRLLVRGSADEEQDEELYMDAQDAPPVASTSAFTVGPIQDLSAPMEVDSQAEEQDTKPTQFQYEPPAAQNSQQDAQPLHGAIEFVSPLGRLSFRVHKCLSNVLGPHYIELLNSDGDKSSWPQSNKLKTDAKGHINGYVPIPTDSAEELRWRTVMGRELAEYQQLTRSSAFPTRAHRSGLTHRLQRAKSGY